MSDDNSTPIETTVVSERGLGGKSIPGHMVINPDTEGAAKAKWYVVHTYSGHEARVAGRTKLDSASPVDVLSGASLRNQGTTELGAALASVAPSIDFPRPSAVDGTDAIRPATLRGLSPDQTLVLINNVRAHTSALLNINGSVGRGSAATDLNTIPTAALDRIEVLRDGASAQYGSDAIAGVVNLRLREARSQVKLPGNWELYKNAALLELGVADPKRIDVTTLGPNQGPTSTR